MEIKYIFFGRFMVAADDRILYIFFWEGQQQNIYKRV
jgi:hypothetical protein